MSGPSWTPVKANGGGAPAGAPGGPPGAGPSVGGGAGGVAKPGVGGWAQKNKVVIGAGAVGVVVVLALLNRSKGSEDTAAAGTTVSGTTGGQGTYDSSSADTYNALQPEIENLRNLVEQFMANTVPVPAATGSDITTPVATTPTANTVPISGSPGFGTITSTANNTAGDKVVVSDSVATSTQGQASNFSSIAVTANQQWTNWQQWLQRSDVSQADKNALVASANYQAVKTTVGK